MASAKVPVRGTQSFVGTLSSTWSRPWVTGLEVLWRWIYGIPALWLVVSRLKAILLAHTDGTLDVGRLGLDKALLADPVGALTADPLGAVGKMTAAIDVLRPDLVHLASWLLLPMVAVWIVISSFGRTVVLRKARAGLAPRPGTLMILQTVRIAALAAVMWIWIECVLWAGAVAVQAPTAAHEEPNLVLYCAILIVSTLVLFVFWGAVSWFFSVTPLIAMLRNVGAAESLGQAFGLGPMGAKLAEINLVMGIVKIALLVLAMVFSATPLPFQSVTTPEFLLGWNVVVLIGYVLWSDFFHVARLVAYLELWRVYEESA